MAILPPNKGLITESNQQYYAGTSQVYVDDGAGQTVFDFSSFNTELVYYTNDSTERNFTLNNQKFYTSPDGYNWTEYTIQNSVSNIITSVTKSVVTLNTAIAQGNFFICELKETPKEENYQSYAYTKLKDVIENFMVAYVGEDKLIPNVKRTDVIFHAKRGLQEFSFDTLKSIKSQELTLPEQTLSVIIPQDYVNYVSLKWVDNLGVLHPIYPANGLTTNPYSNPLQDDDGDPIQDNFGANVKGTSQTEKAWRDGNNNLITKNWGSEYWKGYADNYNDPWTFSRWAYGQRYGLNPETSQFNGWFTINEREGKFSFSSSLKGATIILEYISDGLAYDLDTRVPKLAEDALYSHISYSILANRARQPEYVIRRLKKDRSAKLRNAKIRLSNIKLSEIVQVMRNKSKIIKF
jgi:hypothetical protein